MGKETAIYKTDLIKILHKKFGKTVKKDILSKIVSLIFEEMIIELQQFGTFYIKNFGTFYVDKYIKFIPHESFKKLIKDKNKE